MKPMDKIKVSIIIPAYNSEKYLAEAIQSAIAQTWLNKEVIVVDDGSADSSLQIAKSFESLGVKAIHQSNKGAAAARNTGLVAATGSYIQFLDGDDLLSPEKIEKQIELLSAYPGYLGLCETIHFFDNEDHTIQSALKEWYAEGTDNPTDFLVKLYGGSLIGPQYGGMIGLHAWLCPIDVIKKAGNWNEELTVDDDGEFFARVVLASKGIKYAPNAKAYYRKFKTAHSLSAQKTYNACKNHLLATQLKAEHLLALAKTNDAMAKLALSRLFWEISVNLYPQYPDLVLQAENKAHELTPDFKYQPYTTGIKGYLSKLTGWKIVNYLQYLKTRILK